jgi:hypothetical protein
MSKNLTSQVRGVHEALKAMANGDLSNKVTVDGCGEMDDLKCTVNGMVDKLYSFTNDLLSGLYDYGREGELGRQMRDHGMVGRWKEIGDEFDVRPIFVLRDGACS